MVQQQDQIEVNRTTITSQNKLIAFVYDQLWTLRKLTRSKAAQNEIMAMIDKIESWPQRRAI